MVCFQSAIQNECTSVLNKKAYQNSEPSPASKALKRRERCSSQYKNVKLFTSFSYAARVFQREAECVFITSLATENYRSLPMYLI